MRLAVDEIAAVTLMRRRKEMIEAGFKYLSGGGIARNVSTELSMRPVGSNNQGQGVPAHCRGQPLLDLQVTGMGLLALGGDRVAVRSVGRGGRQQTSLR